MIRPGELEFSAGPWTEDLTTLQSLINQQEWYSLKSHTQNTLLTGIMLGTAGSA